MSDSRPKPYIVSTGYGSVDLHQIAGISLERGPGDYGLWYVTIALVGGAVLKEPSDSKDEAIEWVAKIHNKWIELYK